MGDYYVFKCFVLFKTGFYLSHSIRTKYIILIVFWHGLVLSLKASLDRRFLRDFEDLHFGGGWGMERALLVNAWLHLFCIVMKNFLWVLMMSVPSAHRVFFCQHNKEPNVKSSHTFRIWQPWCLGGLHCVIWVQLWAVDYCRNLDRSVRGKKKKNDVLLELGFVDLNGNYIKILQIVLSVLLKIELSL